ncbi:MAG: flagellar hook-basal body complex protein [Bacillota bacterium]
MLRALWAAASGMIAQQTAVDVISHNLANVNTAGFKASRVEFGDVVSGSNPPAAGAQIAWPGSSPGQPAWTGQAVAGAGVEGAGVRVVGTRRSFLPGQLEQTGQPLDLAIHGPGFFRVELEGGETFYTRSGSFRLGPDGKIYTSEGHRLAVSSWDKSEGVDAGAIRVDPDGRMWVKVNGSTRQLGEIVLVTFPNPAGLQAAGGGLYRETDASGKPRTGGEPGEIWQGFLERSNVQVVEEIVGLIMAQRAYEMNSKVVQAADEMLGMANNLRR